MNNPDVEATLVECARELDSIVADLDRFGSTHKAAPYLTMYALMRACGAVELASKTIVADFCNKGCGPQIRQFITTKVRDNSRNPSYTNICKMLGDFDKAWVDEFKTAVASSGRKGALLDSLQSLVDARNEFAHGGSPSCSIRDVKQYFGDALVVLTHLDATVC
jgi:hypothetical protein